MVRVWRAAEPESGVSDPQESLRGFVEHVSTGATTRFGGGAELLRFLRSSPTPDDSECLGEPASPEEGDPR